MPFDRCPCCGIIARKSQLLESNALLLVAIRPLDWLGRRDETMYCKKCNHISHYVRFLGVLRFVENRIDARLLLPQFRRGAIKECEISKLTAKVQRALIRDKLLPLSWQLH